MAPGSAPTVFPTVEAPQSNHPRSPTLCDQYESKVDQLSRLHVDLCRLLISPLEKGSEECPLDLSSGNASFATVGVAKIDETFVATQTLIGIMQHLFPNSSPADFQVSRYHSVHLRSPSCDLAITNENSLSLLVSPEGSTTSADHGSDTVTILLTLTCYLRLLHIYGPLVVSLHQLLQASTSNHPAGPQSSRSPADSFLSTTQISHLRLPAFSLGSFSLNASSDLNIGLLLHLVSHMLERIQGAVRTCFPSASTSRVFSAGGSRKEAGFRGSGAGAGAGAKERSTWLCSPMTSVAEAVLNEVSEKERSLMAMLHATKEILGV